jgi:hypothetical protein
VWAALEAGKHVLCEARMAMNAAEARTMLDAARRAPQLVTQLVPAPNTLEVDSTLQALLAEAYVEALEKPKAKRRDRPQADPTPNRRVRPRQSSQANPKNHRQGNPTANRRIPRRHSPRANRRTSPSKKRKSSQKVPHESVHDDCAVRTARLCCRARFLSRLVCPLQPRRASPHGKGRPCNKPSLYEKE